MTNTTRENANAPIFNRNGSIQEAAPTSGYNVAQSHFQDQVLSEFEPLSSREERLPQKLAYGSNPNGFRLKTLDPTAQKPKRRSLKYLNQGFAEEEVRVQDYASIDDPTDAPQAEEAESRLQTRQAQRCGYGIVENPKLNRLVGRPLRPQPEINRHM